MRKFIAALTVAALTFVGVGTAAAPAQGHTASTYFSAGLWPDNQVIAYGLDAGFPAGDFRSRVLDGATAWRAFSSTNTPDIYWTEADDVEWGSHSVFESGCKLRGKINVGGVFYQDLDPWGTSLIGQTSVCAISGVKKSFTLTFDKESNLIWYISTGSTPATAYDAASVAAHEFGHALGWLAHYPSGAAECPLANMHTMCSAQNAGNWAKRDTEIHDEHTFDAAY